MEIKGNNEFTHIVLKYNENKKNWEDITSQVIYVKDNTTSWYVAFENHKTYNFKYNNLIVSTTSEEISLEDKKVYVNGIPIKVYKIFYFKKAGYKIFFHDYNSKFFKNIEFKDSKILIKDLDVYRYNTCNKVLDYYKSLAHYASDVSNEEDAIEKLVFNLYSNIDTVNTNSALYSYTNQQYKKNSVNMKNLIFPFSTNASQMKAVEMVMANNLSTISGPPGTGKTQVILNIIANYIVMGKKIAVISNNNTAVENVHDKLEELNYDFLLASLGNLMNVENFFKKEDNLKDKLKTIKVSDNKNEEDYLSLLEDLYEAKNNLQILKDELYKIEVEYNHFKDKNKDKELEKYDLNINDYNTILELKNYLLWSKKLNIFRRIYVYFKYRLKIKSIKDINNFLFFLDNKYYELKQEHLKLKINKLNYAIESNNIKEYEELLKEQSINKLNEYLLKKYSNSKFPIFTKDNYKNIFDKFIDRYPVTLSTTHSLLRNCEPGFMYDLVIIDEGSQSDILTTLLTMNITKNIVIIGDQLQLSQIDNKNIYEMSEDLAKKYNIADEYKYKENSILKSVSSLKNKPASVLLREHYRCDLRIIKFCNEKFYNNNLIVCTNTSKEDPLEVIYTVKGNHARRNPYGTGQYNSRECDEIINILNTLDTDNVGIITPFKAQAEHIHRHIKDDFPNVEVDTIHKYQGRQKDVIILSTVVNALSDSDDDFITNFVTNSQLLNVAISRAVKKIYLVVSHDVYESRKNTISQLIEYIKYYCNDNIKEGQVVSIFDVLYTDSYKTLKNQKFKNIFDSYAEEVMLNKLFKILKNYPEYSISMHVKLDDLINDYTGLTESELKYVKHHKTHVDFVIFDKITYKPKLCIEVDGTSYHDYYSKQIEHDEIKTRVLKNNNINILRLKTNQSNETEKIIKYL